MALLHGLHGCQQGAYGVAASSFIQLPGGYSHFFFPALQHIDLFVIELCKIFYDLVIEGKVRNGFAVKVDQFAGAKDHGGAVLQDAVIRQCFNNYFRSNAVQVAAANANNRFVHKRNSGLKVNNNKKAIT